MNLDELEALAAQATEGPWTGPDYDGASLWEVYAMNAGSDYLVAARMSEANARFIAAARSAVPALIHRVRELESVATFGVCNKCGWGGPIDPTDDFHSHPDCRYSAVAVKERVP